MSVSYTSAVRGGSSAADDTAYDATTWNSNTDAPTKNAVRDKIESLSTGATAGMVVQVVNYQTGTGADSTTAIPFDGTIPQNTEGSELMTLAITPTSATNKLKITVNCQCGAPAGGVWALIALFQDSTASAIAGSLVRCFDQNNSTVCLTYYMTAGTTSATTFKVRGGTDTGATFNFNISGLWTGIPQSSMTIEEIKV